MFKKSLIAVAVLGATAFSVQAADVTMYGKVDTGLQYQSNEITILDQTVVDTDSFTMENGRRTRTACAYQHHKWCGSNGNGTVCLLVGSELRKIVREIPT